MLHDLLRVRDLRSAIAWVLRQHQDKLAKEPDILHALQTLDPGSSAEDAAKHLSLFLLLIGDNPGAQLALSLSRSTAAQIEICRLANTPHQHYSCEPLSEEQQRKNALQPLLMKSSETLLAWAAQNHIPPAIARLDGGSVLGLSFLPMSATGDTCFNFFAFNPNNPNKVRGLEDPGMIPIIGPSSFLACFDGVDEHARGVLIGNNENFGHWLFNHLARLALIESVPELAKVPLIVGENITPPTRMSRPTGF